DKKKNGKVLLETHLLASAGMALRHVCQSLVPTARLELAQLSPLPPQDSVSTNFTTSAGSMLPGSRGTVRTCSTTHRVYPEYGSVSGETSDLKVENIGAFPQRRSDHM